LPYPETGYHFSLSYLRDAALNFKGSLSSRFEA